jgi:hypothetical protein
MPYDLQAIERGYGETDVEWTARDGNLYTILIRYHADLNNRALIAMKRMVIGVMGLDGKTRFPDVEGIIEEVIRVLLPSGTEIPEDERGWDLTKGDESVPITFDTVVDLEPGLPTAILGAIFKDIQDPNRRRPSRRGSSPGAVSQPIVSPITSDSSRMPNGQASLPGPSPASPIPVVTGPVGASGYGS